MYRLPLVFHFLCFHCSSMVPASRNPMWGEEFNFFVDELPVQVDILCCNFFYTSSCDHLHWNIGESLWKSCARCYCKMILACCNLKCFKGICLHLVCQFILRGLFLLILFFNINDCHAPRSEALGTLKYCDATVPLHLLIKLCHIKEIITQ